MFYESKPSPGDLIRFAKIIEAVHRVPGKLRQFIALYAPSLSGKTLLAICLDRLTEHPLYERDRPFDLDNRLLKACFRLPCNSVFDKLATMQTINSCPIEQSCFKEAVTSDFDYLENERKRNSAKELRLEDTVSLSSILEPFRWKKSKTLAILADSIRARLSGAEREAFRKGGVLPGTMMPLSIEEFVDEFQIGDHSKPLVFFLDEFAVSSQQDPRLKGHLLFLRNILRATRLVVIIMGTNATAINMIDRIAVGNFESGFNAMLWAQAVTNVFAPLSISQFEGSVEMKNTMLSNGLTSGNVDAVINWLNEGRCVKPGPMKTLLSRLRSKIVGSVTETLWEALKYAGDVLVSRKSSSNQFYYLLGQVEAMISTTRFANLLEPADSLGLVNEHYASLATYTSEGKIDLFSLYRIFKGNRLCLSPLSWEPYNLDIKLDGLAVDNDCPEKGKPYLIKDYLDGQGLSLS